MELNINELLAEEDDNIVVVRKEEVKE